MREDSGIAPGLSSLPEGGGGVSALGDRFQPDLVRGSGSYAVSINCPKGLNELQPSLTLSYSAGSGNGPFGLGWRLNVLRIERRSDRGIPGYTDSDTFMIGDAEVLVPVGGNRYRPKTDTKFWRIGRVDDTWQIRTGDGKTMLFGQTPASRESNGTRVFTWYLDEERDAAGNTVFYSYRRDQNRLYLEEVNYSIFRVRFLYEFRPDLICNGRSGFARVTALRANAIELHCDRLLPTIMHTYSLAYAQAQNGASLLVRFTLSATDGTTTASAPELTFDYSTTDFTVWTVHEIQSLIAPPGLDNPDTQLVDMTGDGLPDVLQSFGSQMLLWHNHGNGSLEGPTALDGVPSTVSLERDNVALADLNGDGRIDLFAVDQPLQLAFVSNGRGGFLSDPIVFRNRPDLRLAAADTRLMDMDGDGVTDLISAGQDYFLLFRHIAGQGWQEPYPVARVADLDRFPDVSFQDRGVRLADMTGDGLQDFLVVHSGDVSYWPYVGNGVWGDRVPMEHPPQFPPGYGDDRVQVIDLDGDGCSDIVYFDYDRTVIWLNQSGASFAAPIEVPVAPKSGSARILPADFFGDGRAGFLWTSIASGEYSAGYRFLRFDAGRRSYLMTTIRNGMGRQTEIEYATTTVMRLEDEGNGENWPGQLPFVVPVVCAIHDRDTVSGAETRVAIHYHDGVYDGSEREFRGFTRVTVDMAGDDSIPQFRQEYRFYQGDPDEPDLSARERQRALAGSFQMLRTFEQTDGGFQLRHESTQIWDARSEFDDTVHHVFFPFLVQIENREHSFSTSPQRIERTQFLNYDTYGNAGKRIRESFAEGDSPERAIRTEEYFVYTQNEAAWLVKLPVRSELRDGTGVPFAIMIHYYDGPPFQGLPEGQTDRGLLTRTQELVLLEARLPADYIGDRDLTTLGYDLQGGGDTRGYYATTQSCRRDNSGNMIEQRDPLGALSRITYDADGVYPIQKTDARGKVTQITFDPKSGEPAHVALPDGRVFRFQTDPLGRIIAQFEVDDTGQEQLVKCWLIDVAVPVSVTSFAPDRGGRQVSEFSTAADLTMDGRIEVLRDHSGAEVARYTFAGSDEPIRIAHRDAGTRTYYRDAAGRIVELIRTDGSRLFYRFDVSGRLLRIEHAAPNTAVTSVVRELFYDSDPGAPSVGRFLDERIALVREAGNEMRYSYKRAGSVVREEVTAGDSTLATAWEYNLRQDVTALTYPDGHRIEYARDSSGAVQQIPGTITHVTYTEEGYIDGYTFVNGVQVTLPLDALSRRLSNVSATANGATLRSISYSYDAIGNITGLHDEMPGTVEHQTFVYDGLYRLISFESRADNENGPVLRTETYQYDPEGNILQIGSQNARTLAYADVLHPGRVTAVTSGANQQGVQYEERGSIRAWDSLTAIEYDSLDRVLQVTRGDGIKVQFASDPQNRRILKQVTAGAVTRSVHYASNLYEKHDTQAVRHIYLSNRLVVSENVSPAGMQPAFFLSDHHGTILLATGAAGAILQNQHYSPFGLALDATNTLDRYLGYERDLELGLLQFGVRYYAPTIGRFISPDWYVLENPTRPMRMPQGFNVYSYALNNPLVFKDPSGKWFFLVPFVVGFVAGLVYGLADGQKWDAFGTALETGLTTGFGAALGGTMLTTAGLGTFNAVMGGINGLFTGLRKTYDWGSIEGWASFVSDSTWGIIGTSLGNALNIVNLIAAPSSYDRNNSKRQNRQVYDRGFALGSGTAFTQGNVISNLDRGIPGSGDKILKHEQTHILQNRLLGPLYLTGNLVWYSYGIYYGFWLGLVLWPFIGQDPFKSANDIAHDDNPFELWAFSVGGESRPKGKLSI